MAKQNTLQTGLANNTVLTVANSDDGTAGDAFTTVPGATTGKYITDTSALGTLSLEFTPVAGALNDYFVFNDSASGSAFTISALIYLTGYPASTQQFPFTCGPTAGGQTACLHLNSTGHLIITNAAGTEVSTGGIVPLNTWVWVNFFGTCNATTGSATFKTYRFSDQVQLDSLTATNINTGTTNGRVIYGKFSASGAMAPYRWGHIRHDMTSSTEYALIGGNQSPTITLGLASSPIVGYIGDSLTYEGGVGEANIAASLASLGLDTTNFKVNGVIGRSISQNVAPWPTYGTTDVIADWRGLNFHPNFWVMALSSNDFDASISTLQARVNTVKAVVDDEPYTHVLWIGPAIQPSPTTITDTQITNIYTALNNVAATWPEMHVLDMRAAFNALPSQTGFWTDDRHMTTTGYAAREAIIKPFVQTYLPTVSPATNVDAGDTVTITVTDPDGTISSVVITGMTSPPTISGTGSVRTFTAPPRLSDTVLTVTATDDDGATATDTITVNASGITVCDYTGTWVPAYVIAGV